MEKRPAYISGGLGDFIAIESFLTLQEKEAVTGFFLFTRAAYLIRQLIEVHPIWKNLPVTIPFTPGEIRSFNTYSFFMISSVYRLTRSPAEKFGYLSGCFDWSGDRLYPGILNGTRKFTESLFDIYPSTKTPQCVIDAASQADDRATRKGRNLTPVEITNTLTRYPDAQFVGSNAMSLIESMSLIKRTPVFIGVDSAMSVYAARCKDIKKIVVKSVNPVYYKWKTIYDPLDRVEAIGKI